MAAKQIAQLILDMTTVTEIFQKMSLKQIEGLLNEKTPNVSIQKLLELEEAIGSLRKTIETTDAKSKKKESVQCAYCDKKLINMKAHIQNIHTCEHCKDATVRDMYEHQNGCKDYVKAMTESASNLGATYIHSERDYYKVKDGNVYDYEIATESIGEYVGRLRTDNTLDRDAKELTKEKELSPCPYCDKKYLNVKMHIHHSHTCAWCNNNSIKDKDLHLNTCKDYIKWTAEQTQEKDNYAICQKYGLTILEGKGYKISDGNKVYEFDYDTCLPGECIGRVGPGGTIIRPKETSSAEGGGSKKKKEKIPAHIKTLVWSKYIGSSIPEAKCYCCKHERIEIRSFECGHVIAEAKGGELTLENLRPICKGCNSGMGTMSMDEYAKKFFGWSVLTGQQLVAVAEDPVSNKETKDIHDLDIFLIPITPSKKEQLPAVDPFADLLSF
jgi:5-methylcytosine-specific restriction endonuclease McrA